MKKLIATVMIMVLVLGFNGYIYSKSNSSCTNHNNEGVCYYDRLKDCDNDFTTITGTLYMKDIKYEGLGLRNAFAAVGFSDNKEVKFYEATVRFDDKGVWIYCQGGSGNQDYQEKVGTIKNGKCKDISKITMTLKISPTNNSTKAVVEYKVYNLIGVAKTYKFTSYLKKGNFEVKNEKVNLKPYNLVSSCTLSEGNKEHNDGTYLKVLYLM